MRAAAAGRSNLDIPQTVGEEFSESDRGGKLPARKTTFTHQDGDWLGLERRALSKEEIQYDPIATTGHSLDADGNRPKRLPRVLRPNQEVSRIGAFEPQQPAAGFGFIRNATDGRTWTSDWLERRASATRTVLDALMLLRLLSPGDENGEDGEDSVDLRRGRVSQRKHAWTGDWLGVAKHGQHDQEEHGNRGGGARRDIGNEVTGETHSEVMQRLFSGQLRVGDYIANTSMRTIQGTIVGEGTFGGRMKIPAYQVRDLRGTMTLIPKVDARPLGYVLPEGWANRDLGSPGNPKTGKPLEKALTPAQHSEIDAETEQIKQNREKATYPHDFRPAEWTFPNGHPRCLTCGQEERGRPTKLGLVTVPCELEKHGTHDQATHGHDAFGRVADEQTMLRSDLRSVDRVGRLDAEGAQTLLRGGLAYRPEGRSTLALTDKGRAMLAKHGDHDQRSHGHEGATVTDDPEDEYRPSGLVYDEPAIGGVGHHLPTNPDLGRLHSEMWGGDRLSPRDRDLTEHHLADAHGSAPWSDRPLTPSGKPQVADDRLHEAHRMEHRRL